MKLSPNKITAHNAGWRSLFRIRGSHRWPGVCEFRRSPMKLVFIALLPALLAGCVERDLADLARYDKAQLARYERYNRGSVSEAKRALEEVIDEARRNRGKFKHYYGAEWEVCLCYGRLALIAEHEGDPQSAQRYWDLAVDAQLQYQKDERKWGRANPRVDVLNEGSDVYERVSRDSIRNFLLGLEKDQQISWKLEHEK